MFIVKVYVFLSSYRKLLEETISLSIYYFFKCLLYYKLLLSSIARELIYSSVYLTFLKFSPLFGGDGMLSHWRYYDCQQIWDRATSQA